MSHWLVVVVAACAVGGLLAFVRPGSAGPLGAHQVLSAIFRAKGARPSAVRLPFVLPSGSTFGQLGLVGTMLAFAVSLHPAVYDVLFGGDAGHLVACLRGISVLGVPRTVGLGQEACRGGHGPGTAGPVLVAVVLVLCGVAWVFLQPRWRVGAAAAIPLEKKQAQAEADDKKAVSPYAAAQAACRKVADSVKAIGGDDDSVGVDFRIALADGSRSAHALGLRSYPVVVISRGAALTTARDRPAAFEAMIRHELAHVRNGDLGITSFADGVWYTFAFGVLLPTAALAGLGSLFGPVAPSVALLGDVLAVLALMWVGRSAFQRAREVRADALARAWGAATGAEDLAAALADTQSPSGWSGLRRAARRMRPQALGALLEAAADRLCEVKVPDPVALLTRPLFNRHPDREHRLGALANTRLTLRAQAVSLHVLGACLVLVRDPADSFLGRLSAWPLAQGWPATGWGMVVGLSVGTALFRDAMATEDAPNLRRWWLAPTAFATGLVTGEILAPSRVASALLPLPLTVPATGLCWAALAALAWLLVMWAQLAAYGWARFLMQSRYRARAASLGAIPVIGLVYAQGCSLFFPLERLSAAASDGRRAGISTVWAQLGHQFGWISERAHFGPTVVLLCIGVLMPWMERFIREDEERKRQRRAEQQAQREATRAANPVVWDERQSVILWLRACVIAVLVAVPPVVTLGVALCGLKAAQVAVHRPALGWLWLYSVLAAFVLLTVVVIFSVLAAGALAGTLQEKATNRLLASAWVGTGAVTLWLMMATLAVWLTKPQWLGPLWTAGQGLARALGWYP